MSGNYIGLVRVSTEEQAGDDRASFPAQRESITRTAKSKNLTLREIVEIRDVSGTNVLEAPEIQRILKLISTKEVAGVIVADLDRLFRPKKIADYSILAAFQDAGAPIVTESGTYDLCTDEGSMMGLLKGMFGGQELRTFKRRVQRAREEKRKAGKLGGSPTILPTGIGFDFESEKFFYTDRIDAVKLAFRIVDEEKVTNYQTLSKRTGIKPRTLYNLLRNPIFRGYRIIDKKRGAEKYASIGGRQADAKKVNREPHEVISVKVFEEPAVSPDQWYRVQNILEEKANCWRRDRDLAGTVVNLSAGVAFCGECGSRFYTSSGRRKGGKDRMGYCYCSTNDYASKRKGHSCSQPNLQKPDVHRLLTEFVCNHLRRPELIKAIIASFKARQSAAVAGLQNPEQQFSKINAKKSRLLELLMEKTIASADYQMKMAELEEAEAKIKSVHEESRRLSQRSEVSKAAIQHIISGCLAFAQLSSEAARQAALRSLFARVYFRGSAIIGFTPQIGNPDRPSGGGSVLLRDRNFVPSSALDVCESGSRTGRGSSPRRA